MFTLIMLLTKYIFPKIYAEKREKSASWHFENYDIADIDVVDVVQIVEKPLRGKKEEKWAEWHFGGSSSPVWILSCAPTTNP